ncbi:MAG: 50S ribosomal protein L29 [Alphaproteobacteria bacterium]|nr:50S ribosomal protein L29 [Alphaproteobacteria bacterium]
MKYAELSSLSDEQLVHRELTLERELITARFRLYTNQLEDTASIAKLRKAIAHCRTAARGREAEQGLSKNSLRDRYSSTFKASGPVEETAASGDFLKGFVDSADASE